MLTSSLRTPEFNSGGKRKWISNDDELIKERQETVSDILQTPQTKRARRENDCQEASTPFGKVATWVRETAKKTVRIFTSFRERFWRDDIEDQENEIYPPPVVYGSINMESQRQFDTDELRLTQVQDEEIPSSSSRRRWQPLEYDLSQHLHNISSRSGRAPYNSSNYGNHTTAASTKHELSVFPSSRCTYDQFCGSSAEVPVRKTQIREMKPTALKPRNTTAFKIRRQSATVDNVVRLQEREQYMKLLAHYTSSTHSNYGSVRKAIVVEDKDQKDPIATWKRQFQTKHSPLSSESLNPRILSAEKELRQPVAAKAHGLPSQIPHAGTETSRPVVSSSIASNHPGILELQGNARPPRRSTDFLDDNWIKKWRETLSAEYLEQQRKIAKEKLKLEAIRKEKHDLELVSKQVKERMRGKREGIEVEFPEFSDEMDDVVDKALGHGAPNELLVEFPIGRITRGDIITLQPQTWLNDEVVNAYFHIIVERSRKTGPKIHAFNTFFYPKLMKTGHASVRRWTKKVDLFTIDIILIPVHLGMHWCLAVIDMERKTFTYYDSLKGENPGCIQAMRDYICAESLDKKKTNLDLTGWRNDSPKTIPEQLNGCDCGVFACKYAEYVSRRAAFNFTQHHMPYFRRRMVYEILKKTLL